MKLGSILLRHRIDLHEEQSGYGTGGPIGLSILMPVTALLYLFIDFLWALFIGFFAALIGLILVSRARFEHQNLVYESIIMVFGIEVLIGILYYDVIAGGRVPIWWYALLVGLAAYGTTRAIPTIRAWLEWMQEREVRDSSLPI